MGLTSNAEQLWRVALAVGGDQELAGRASKHRDKTKSRQTELSDDSKQELQECEITFGAASCTTSNKQLKIEKGV